LDKNEKALKNQYFNHKNMNHRRAQSSWSGAAHIFIGLDTFYFKKITFIANSLYITYIEYTTVYSRDLQTF
jgi:hypothetical protein